ncbi:MAG TPA: hypothetical protein P5256_19730, partial [Beijerinckiaceae bacterium]|nr:hypothetical protein [Hyphomicrobiales bacterium]HRY05374.1 hypothetical protein [Beijerinckiaceae bacterium]
MNTPCRIRWTLFTIACALVVGQPASSREIARKPKPAAGVNLAGAEFGAPPGKADKDFHFPSEAEFAWAKKKGFAVVRLPFLWERLQPVLEKDFDAAHLAL